MSKMQKKRRSLSLVDFHRDEYGVRKSLQGYENSTCTNGGEVAVSGGVSSLSLSMKRGESWGSCLLLFKKIFV